MCIVRASGRLQARHCGAPASRSDFADGSIRLSLLGPAGLPSSIATRFQAEVARVVPAPERQKTLEQDALTPIANTPEQFAAMYRAGFDVYVRSYKAAGIKPE